MGAGVAGEAGRGGLTRLGLLGRILLVALLETCDKISLVAGLGQALFLQELLQLWDLEG